MAKKNGNGKKAKAPGPAKLKKYFTQQREEFGRRNSTGDTIAKMAGRIGLRGSVSLWRISEGQATTYDTAKKIENETGIPWYDFEIGRGTIPYDVLRALVEGRR